MRITLVFEALHGEKKQTILIEFIGRIGTVEQESLSFRSVTIKPRNEKKVNKRISFFWFGINSHLSNLK